MNIFRKNSIAAGSFLLIAIVVGIISVAINVTPEGDYLAKLSNNEGIVILSGLLQVMMAFACVGIVSALYPVLKKFNQTLAIGSLSFRVIEGAIFAVSASMYMSVLSLSRRVEDVSKADYDQLQLMAKVIKNQGGWFGEVGGTIAFCIGALLYYIVFYQSKLIPRWLSLWGMIAIVSHLLSQVFVLFGMIDGFSGIGLILNFPIILNEITLGVWLVVKGFDQSEL